MYLTSDCHNFGWWMAWLDALSVSTHPQPPSLRASSPDLSTNQLATPMLVYSTDQAGPNSQFCTQAQKHLHGSKLGKSEI
jgi:hypothetical protein